MVRTFLQKEEGNIYTRIMNPTTDVLKKGWHSRRRVGALAVASGMAAITTAILNITKAGDEIVSYGTLYGGTYNLFVKPSRYGIKTTL